MAKSELYRHCSGYKSKQHQKEQVCGCVPKLWGLTCLMSDQWDALYHKPCYYLPKHTERKFPYTLNELTLTNTRNKCSSDHMANLSSSRLREHPEGDSPLLTVSLTSVLIRLHSSLGLQDSHLSYLSTTACPSRRNYPLLTPPPPLCKLREHVAQRKHVFRHF